MSLGLDAKLERFDQHAAQAVAEILEWLSAHPEQLIAVARGRHVTGHMLYEDANFAEWELPRLRKEVAEELADAICYTTRAIWLRSQA